MQTVLLALLSLTAPPVVYDTAGRTATVTVDTPMRGVATHSPSDVLGWVAADLATLPETTRHLYRYISIPPTAGKDWDLATSLILNEAVSQSPAIVTPQRLANGWLLRVYLPDLFPTVDAVVGVERGSDRLVRLWDAIAFQDFRFYDNTQRFLIKVPAYIHTDGRRYSAIYGARYGAWLDARAANMVQGLSGDGRPVVVSADIFAALSYTTVNTPVGRGRYYELAGVDFRIRNQRDEIFRSLGASLKASERLNAQRRAGFLVSNVTFRTRIIERTQGVTGEVWRTLDYGRNQDLRQFQPFNNLNNLNHAAEEIFVEKPNGLRIMLASAANGALQASVPDDVATNGRTASGDRRITPGFGCVSCHNAPGADGFLNFTDQLHDILSAYPPIVDDQSNTRLSVTEAVNKLRGQYGRAVQLRADLEYARARYALAVRQATWGGTPAQLQTALNQIHYRVFDGLVDAQFVLRELGINVPAEQAVAELNRRAPYARGVQLEDITLRALRLGKAVKYEDYVESYSRIAEQVLFSGTTR